MDSAKSHFEGKLESYNTLNTECKIIDGGIVPLLQFIGTCANKLFKHTLREIIVLIVNVTEVPQARQPSTCLLRNCLSVSVWGIEDGSKTRIFLISGFWECGYIEWENDYQKLHLRLSDTILNQAVLIETILEVNEMLLEYGEAIMDVAKELHEYIDIENGQGMGDKLENSSDEEDIIVE